MKIEGRYSFFSGPELVWARLLETEVLAGCIPGCREFTAVDEDNYEVEINAGFGAISGTFNGTIKVIKRDAPRSFRMVVEGRARRVDFREMRSSRYTMWVAQPRSNWPEMPRQPGYWPGWDSASWIRRPR